MNKRSIWLLFEKFDIINKNIKGKVGEKPDLWLNTVMPPC